MIKDKKPNWKDTNVALIGSEIDHLVKQAAAKGEPQWTGVGSKVELRVWRIEQFRVVAWPRAKYGKFHEGDSYIVLNTWKQERAHKLNHDVHIWIGHESSQDEYGAAAYKMVECDEVLGGAAVQHREVQGEESQLFLSYFGGRTTILCGGVASGFNHVDLQDADALEGTSELRLYRVKGKGGNIQLTQVNVRRDHMNSGDVFILNAGRTIFQWNGADANTSEKLKGGEILKDMASPGVTTVVLDQGVNDKDAQGDEFWKHLPSEMTVIDMLEDALVHCSCHGTREVQETEKGGDDNKIQAFVPTLYYLGTSRISYAAQATMVNAGKSDTKSLRIKRSSLNPLHVMLLDTGFHVFIWQGKEADYAEKTSAILRVRDYLQSYRRPEGLPVTMVKQDQRGTDAFETFFYDAPKSWLSWLIQDCSCARM